MNPAPYDIYLVPARLNQSKDKRPCIVLDAPRGGEVPVVLLSAQRELYNSLEHFLLDKDHADFDATGLSKTSYALPRIVIVPASQLLKYKGKLSGDLLREFVDWIG